MSIMENTTMSENTTPLSRGPLVVLPALDLFDAVAMRARARRILDTTTDGDSGALTTLIAACDEVERLRLVLGLIQTVAHGVALVRASKGEPAVSALDNIQDVIEMTLGGAPL